MTVLFLNREITLKKEGLLSNYFLKTFLLKKRHSNNLGGNLTTGFSDLSTQDLVLAFFRWRNFGIGDLNQNESSSRVDFIVKPPEESKEDDKNILTSEDAGLNVVVIDSKRSLGYNTILTVRSQLESIGNSDQKTCIFVGDCGYSQSAKEMADKEGFILMTRGELVSIFKSERINPREYVSY